MSTPCVRSIEWWLQWLTKLSAILHSARETAFVRSLIVTYVYVYIYIYTYCCSSSALRVVSKTRRSLNLSGFPNELINKPRTFYAHIAYRAHSCVIRIHIQSWHVTPTFAVFSSSRQRHRRRRTAGYVSCYTPLYALSSRPDTRDPDALFNGVAIDGRLCAAVAARPLTGSFTAERVSESEGVQLFRTTRVVADVVAYSSGNVKTANPFLTLWRLFVRAVYRRRCRPLKSSCS